MDVRKMNRVMTCPPSPTGRGMEWRHGRTQDEPSHDTPSLSHWERARVRENTPKLME